MSVYLVKRLGQTLVTLLFLTLMVFALARLTGDPAPLVLPTEATAQDAQFFRQQYGLDRSLPEQYLIFLGNVSRGDFGVSFRYREPAIGFVMAGLGPAIHDFSVKRLFKANTSVCQPKGISRGQAPSVLSGRHACFDQLGPIADADRDHVIIEIISGMVQACGVAVADENKEG